MHPPLYLSGAQHIKVLPSPPVPGQSIMHTDTFVCVHIPLELMEKERKGRDERGECRNKSGMRNERVAEEGKPIGKLETFFFFSLESVCSILPWAATYIGIETPAGNEKSIVIFFFASLQPFSNHVFLSSRWSYYFLPSYYTTIKSPSPPLPFLKDVWMFGLWVAKE